MDRFETLEVAGWSSAIEGMRAPLKSYDKSDSIDHYWDNFEIGENDYKLAKRLCKAGPEHRKWMRQIQVWARWSLPLYLWQEADTYSIGISKNSESTMHTLTKRNLTWEDFDTEYMDEVGKEVQIAAIQRINQALVRYNITRDEIKKHKYELANPFIEDTDNFDIDEIKAKIADLEEEKLKEFISLKSLLTTSFIQTRYVNLNYEVLHNMYHQRKNHRLPQWSKDFVSWVKTLPYSEFITEEFDS